MTENTTLKKQQYLTYRRKKGCSGRKEKSSSKNRSKWYVGQGGGEFYKS